MLKSMKIGQKIGFIFGIVIFLVLLAMPTPAGMSLASKRMAGIAILMASWWISEAIPISATALLPLVLYPLFGIMSAKKVAPQYGNHLVFLFLGGFIIALAMQKWNLHKRIALHIIKIFGTSPTQLVLGFMVATAFLSMWISNTATTMMMLPIAMSVVLHFSERSNSSDEKHSKNIKNTFGTTLMLGIAYAASIGGVGTLIGTPPNIVFAGFIQKLFPKAPEIGFLQWMLVAIPLVVFFLPLTWYYLCRFRSGNSLFKLVLLKQGKGIIDKEIKQLGVISRSEKIVLVVFISTALLWIFRSPIDLGFIKIPGWSQLFSHPKNIHDATVALFMALIMFFIPGDWQKENINFSEQKLKRLRFIMDWETVERGIPWGILLLFGGGFALAAGFEKTGLAKWIGINLSSLAFVPIFLLILIIAFIMMVLTEVTSNTAITTMMLPILASMAVGMKMNPFLLMIPATLSASYAFMLPVATPPNAIVFGSGWVTIPEMSKAGIILNLFGIVMITLLTYFLATVVFGISFGSMPVWATP